MSLGHERSDRMLARRKKEGWSILYIIAPLSHSLHLVSWTGVRRQDWARTDRRSRGAGGQKESVWRMGCERSLAGLHTQLLSVGRLVRLWFRAGVRAAVEGRHRAPFAVCVQAAVRRVVSLELSVPLGLLQGSNCRSTQKDKNTTANTTLIEYYISLLKDYMQRHQQQVLHLPCCSSSAFCFLRSSMSCWWVWFFRLMYWMYSVALSSICAREACLTEFCQQKFQKTMGQSCSVYLCRWYTFIQIPVLHASCMLGLAAFSTHIHHDFHTVDSRTKEGEKLVSPMLRNYHTLLFNYATACCTFHIKFKVHSSY